MNDHALTPGTDTALDPVCGMEVVIEDAEHASEYKGTTYFFCAKGCRLDFEDDPERILSPEYEPSM
jgi:Cu+-exporting ATPase